MEDDLGVRGRLEDRAGGDQLLAQMQEVGQVAVVGDGDAAGFEVGEHRLDVARETAAGGRIAGVAYGAGPRQPCRQIDGGKCVGDVAHVTFGVETAAVESGDAAGLLTTVLQGMKAESRDR